MVALLMSGERVNKPTPPWSCLTLHFGHSAGDAHTHTHTNTNRLCFDYMQYIYLGIREKKNLSGGTKKKFRPTAFCLDEVIIDFHVLVDLKLYS